jgi:hypothetical protein
MLYKLNPLRYFSGNTPFKAINYVYKNKLLNNIPIFNYFIEANKYITPENMYIKYNNLITCINENNIHNSNIITPKRIALKLSSFDFNKQYIDITIKNFIDNNWQIIIDAENDYYHTKYKLMTNELISKYNMDKCNIIKTYQMYRKDTFNELKNDIYTFSNYTFGVKLVRGAYWKEDIKTDKLFKNKKETDENYNNAIDLLFYENCLENNVAIEKNINIIATHNKNSITKLNNIDNYSKFNNEKHNFEYAYLLGLLDNNEVNLLINKSIPKNIYLPYGEYRYMIPYLIRRYYEVML